MDILIGQQFFSLKIQNFEIVRCLLYANWIYQHCFNVAVVCALFFMLKLIRFLELHFYIVWKFICE